MNEQEMEYLIAELVRGLAGQRELQQLRQENKVQAEIISMLKADLRGIEQSRLLDLEGKNQQIDELQSKLRHVHQKANEALARITQPSGPADRAGDARTQGTAGPKEYE